MYLFPFRKSTKQNKNYSSQKLHVIGMWVLTGGNMDKIEWPNCTCLNMEINFDQSFHSRSSNLGSKLIALSHFNEPTMTYASENKTHIALVQSTEIKFGRFERMRMI